jgi:nitrile hydratase
MNGVHDMGGMHGMGPVEHEANEPVFHAGWEKRTFALNLATMALGRWNIDMSRYTREQMPPAEYLGTSYYEHWLWGLEKLVRERLLTGEKPARAPLRPERVAEFLQNRRAARMPDPVPPKFKGGDRVVARNINPPTHTRVPRYVRGRQGVIDRDHGVFIFPDTNALLLGKKPQHVYSVRFTAEELWGPDVSPRDAVYVDLWDDHLDPIERHRGDRHGD